MVELAAGAGAEEVELPAELGFPDEIDVGSVGVDV